MRYGCDVVSSCGLLSILALLSACSGPEASDVAVNEYCSGKNMIQISAIRMQLKEGERYLQNRQYQLAIYEFENGVKRLGNKYASSRTLDHTHERLILAQAEEHKANFSVAAHLLQNVLSSRINMCQSKMTNSLILDKRAKY